MFEMLKFMNALNIKIWVKTESETIFAIRSHYNIINTKYITCVCVCVYTEPIQLFIIFFTFYVAALY